MRLVCAQDDANHDPQWSYEQLVSAGLKAGERTISRADVDYMLGVSELVFQVLERAWAALGTVPHRTSPRRATLVLLLQFSYLTSLSICLCLRLCLNH